MKQNLQEEIKKLSKLMLINESELSAPVPITKVNSKFGAKRSYETHPGVDLWATSGTEVHSPNIGEVLVAKFSTGACGGTITIKHPNGYQSRYCHIKDIRVSQGDKVEKGQIIGLSGGNSGDKGAGNSKGAHLHFELKKDGVLVNPMEYIDNNISTTTKTSQSSGTSDEKDELDNLLGTSINGISLKDLIGITDDDIESKPDFIELLRNFGSAFKGIKKIE